MYRPLTAACLILVTASLAFVPPGYAQEVEKQPATARDSLLAELRALTARLDSLELVVAELRAARADTTGAVDELEALRGAFAFHRAGYRGEESQQAEPGDQRNRRRSTSGQVAGAADRSVRSAGIRVFVPGGFGPICKHQDLSHL